MDHVAPGNGMDYVFPALGGMYDAVTAQGTWPILLAFRGMDMLWNRGLTNLRRIEKDR